jgi:hypothetical protein
VFLPTCSCYEYVTGGDVTEDRRFDRVTVDDEQERV